MLGTFEKQLTISNQILTAKGGKDIFLVRWNAGGTLAWARSFGSIKDDTAAGFAVDEKENIMVAGTFGAKMNFGEQEVKRYGGDDVYVMAWSAVGALNWVQSFGSQADETVSHVRYRKGRVAVVGALRSLMYINEKAIQPRGHEDTYVVVLKNDGSISWGWSFGRDSSQKTEKSESLRSLSWMTDGGLLFIGDFAGNLVVGTETFRSRGKSDVFLVRLEASGTLWWAKTFGSTGEDVVSEIYVHPAGTIYLKGRCGGDMNMGRFVLRPKGQRDLFLLRFEGEGSALWGRIFGSPTSQLYPSKIQMNADESIVIAGEWKGVLQLKGKTYRSLGENDIYVIQLSRTGDVEWMQSVGGPKDEQLVAIRRNAQGSVTVLGTYRGPMLTSVLGQSYQGGSDVFLLRLDPRGRVEQGLSLGSVQDDRPLTMSYTSNGGLLIGGLTKEAMRVGTQSLLHAGKQDVFLMRLDKNLKLVNSQSFGSKGDEMLLSVFQGSRGEVTLVGRYQGAMKVMGLPLPDKGEAGMFVLRYLP